MKRCCFCDGLLRFAFSRDDRSFGRCSICRGFTRLDEAEGQDFYESNCFSDRVQAVLGAEPNFVHFDEVAPLLKDGSILEIGCGTGHFLAAAKKRGREVLGIETSAHNRSYIKDRWGIETLASIPAGSFDNAVSFNVLEHIANPLSHLLEVKNAIGDEGRYLMSTANADCLVAKLCGSWWAMFKPEDHLSIPSKSSLAMLGDRAGLLLTKVWCSEYPLETPMGLAIAFRDRLSRAKDGVANGLAIERVGGYQRLREMHAFAFVGRTLSWLMLANSIKAIYVSDRHSQL
jgi:SAM-dependent methyltransferase